MNLVCNLAAGPTQVHLAVGRHGVPIRELHGDEKLVILGPGEKYGDCACKVSHVAGTFQTKRPQGDNPIPTDSEVGIDTFQRFLLDVEIVAGEQGCVVLIRPMHLKEDAPLVASPPPGDEAKD